MTRGPTRGAVQVPPGQWTASPFTAISIRVLAAVVPFVVAWFVVIALTGSFYRPPGPAGLVVWFGQALITGLSVSMVTERFTRRALPLASLFNMTLVFPDQAPSRFSMALRSGTVRKLQTRLLQRDRVRPGTAPIKTAAAAVEMLRELANHDRLTRGHAERVRAYSDLIAEEMGLSSDERALLAWGALLHDVGKMAVPPEILNKPTRPSAEEWEVLQNHPAASVAMLEPLQGWLGQWGLAASQHHERWDGAGYPLGLVGTQISTAGRIVAVADAFDVMTSRRSYKAPLSAEAGRKELIRCSGAQFDPDVVRAFLNVSLRSRWLTGPLATLAEMPRVVNLGANLPAASAVVAGTVAAVSSFTVGPPAIDDGDLAYVAPVTVEAAEPVGTVPTPIETSDPTVGSPVPATDGDQPTTVPIESTSTTDVTVIETPGDSLLPTTEGTVAPSTTTTVLTSGVTTPPAPTATTQATTTTTGTAPTTTAPTTTTTAAPTTTTTAPTTTTTTVPPGSPITSADSVTVDQDTDIRIYVLSNDDSGNSAFDEGTLEIIVDPQHADDFRVHNGHLHYRSLASYTGPDSLEYRICNTNGLCATGVVTITVID